jgi:hypothetical protein
MKRKTIFRSILVLFALGIISAGLIYQFVINKPHPDYAKAKPTHIVTAADLFESFRSDRNSAEAKFNGQVVLMTGRLDKIEISEEQVTGVFVFDQGVFGDEGIRCTMLPDHAQSLKGLPENSEIQIKGYLTGFNDTDVILEQCSLIR